MKRSTQVLIAAVSAAGVLAVAALYLVRAGKVPERRSSGRRCRCRSHGRFSLRRLRMAFDTFASLLRRIPRWTGASLAALGAWLNRFAPSRRFAVAVRSSRLDRGSGETLSIAWRLTLPPGQALAYPHVSSPIVCLVRDPREAGCFARRGVRLRDEAAPG